MGSEVLLVNTKNNQAIPFQDQLCVGSHPKSDLYLAGIEPHQAVIEKKSHGYVLRDLWHGQKTRVNGTYVIEALLQSGDEVEFGETHFRFLTSRSQQNLKSKNKSWNEQLTQVPAIAQTKFPVLILGPSGSGKEIMARALHNHSPRREGPFVSVNCSALTETLIESELFGHVKGSFTGASNDRKGAFETARGGTLFLDEIGELPYAMQAKLLRALENEEIRPVGSDRIIKTNVRILAATHQNLNQKIREGKFRSDLYFRLNVVTINHPALCERVEDIEDLFYHFAKQMRVKFSFASIRLLQEYHWPGNIRELRNVVARASAMKPGVVVEPQDVKRFLDFAIENLSPMHPLKMAENSSSPKPGIPNRRQKYAHEKEIILECLKANHGNQRRTALQLGMAKSSLNDRLAYYGVDVADFKI